MKSPEESLTTSDSVSMKKKLFLIDGNSLLYRSYYAIRHLSNSKGFSTNAIFGFIAALRKLQDKENPHYLGIVFDSKGPTVRHEIFKDYKATRKPMPEDLIPQIPVLKSLLEALNIPYYEKPGYEGDDLLGSLAHMARNEGVHTVIVSHDKDLYQLVDPDISIYHPIKETYLNEDQIQEVFGARPSQVVDVLALWGDASDNIPGVTGIGEKTAKALIAEFGSIENLLANLDRIKNPKLRTKIQESRENLDLSRKLAAIHTDIDLAFDLDAFAESEPNYTDLIALLQELEFNSWLQEYIKKTQNQELQYQTILEIEQLQALIQEIKKAKHVAVDTETDSPYPTHAKLVGMSFSTQAGSAYYLPLQHDYPQAPKQIPQTKALDMLKKVLTDPKIKKIGQNIKYDYIVLRKEGITLQGIDLDTMVLSYIIEPNWGKHNLNRLALAYLQVKTTSYQDIVGTGKKEVTMNAVDIEKVTPYACQDADLALRLSQILWPKVQNSQQDRLYCEVERPLVEVLADMETWGIKVDSQALGAISKELSQKMADLQQKIYALSGEEFNLNSPQQLSHILFVKMRLPATKKTRKTRGLSTSLEVLQELAADFPIAKYTLEYRQLAKLKSTYAEALSLLIHPETGRIHTSYNQTVAATGRLSSSDPNLQNIPVRGEWGPRFRAAFIPEKDHLFLAADYSQIELRVLAHMSGDSALIDTFLHDRDIHQETAHQVFGDNGALFDDEPRRRAKIINFSIIYGASAFSLARELKTSQTEAQKFMDVYFEKYPQVKKFLETCVQNAREKGYSETLFGRRRQVPELRNPNKLAQQAGRRIALNTPIQGTAADLIKKAMIDIWLEMQHQGLKSKMILQVHDELVFEVPETEYKKMEKLVQTKMENVMALKVPLRVHLGWGINWDEAK